MDGICTCGARLPEEARFCHKCGRPVDGVAVIDTPEPEPTVAPPQPVSPEPQLPPQINLRNSAAVRIALFASFAICLLFMIPVPALAGAIWQLVLLLAGGFFSVFIYARRTGNQLSVGSGARMGWLTGLFCFVIVTVLFTVVMAVIATPGGRELVLQGLKDNPSGGQAVEQMQELIRTPAGVIGPLLGFFVMLTALPAIGGALGAAVLAREQ